jgi:hypothetical protein
MNPKKLLCKYFLDFVSLLSEYPSYLQILPNAKILRLSLLVSSRGRGGGAKSGIENVVPNTASVALDCQELSRNF